MHKSHPAGLGMGLVEGGGPWYRCQPYPRNVDGSHLARGDPPPHRGSLSLGEKEGTVWSEWGPVRGGGLSVLR